MKVTVSEQKPECSVKDCLRKRKQASNLLHINSHFTTKFMTEKSDAYTLCPTFYKYILQRRQGPFSGFHFLVLALNCEKFSVYLNRQ